MEKFYFIRRRESVLSEIVKVGFRGTTNFYLFGGYKNEPSIRYVVDCGSYQKLKSRLKSGFYKNRSFSHECRIDNAPRGGIL